MTVVVVLCMYMCNLIALTRNPRVDFISKRVEEIKMKKARVAALAVSAQAQLESARKTLFELDRAMLDAFNDELGERKWDQEESTYTRSLHPEEKRMVADMQRVFDRCRETMDKVTGAYMEHLDNTANKPLTYNTPDEEARLGTVMQTKEEYKAVRTLYSDAMIDSDAELATGGAPSTATQQRLEDAKRAYEEMSERLCEDALRYERIYRDELAQRVSAHFTAEQHLLRGVSTAMRDLAPYTRGLTLDWQQLRITRRANLVAAKQAAFEDDEADDLADQLNNLPVPGESHIGSSSNGGGGGTSIPTSPRSESEGGAGSGAANPFGNIAADLSKRGSHAASALSSASKTASKSISDIVSNYGAKGAAKAATKSMTNK